MIDFSGLTDRKLTFVEGIQWARPRLNRGVRIIGYDPCSCTVPCECTRKEWTVADIEHGILMASNDRAGVLFTRFNLEVYFDDPEEEIWFRLRFT